MTFSPSALDRVPDQPPPKPIGPPLARVNEKETQQLIESILARLQAGRPWGELVEQDRLLRLGQVLSLFPVSRSTWYQGIATGRFPKPIKLSQRISAWRLRDILARIDGGNDAE
jgi:prophage regulatory protein